MTWFFCTWLLIRGHCQFWLAILQALMVFVVLWSSLSLPIKKAIAIPRVSLYFLIVKTENVMTDHKSNNHETKSQTKWTRFDYSTHSPAQTEINTFLFWKMELDRQGYMFSTKWCCGVTSRDRDGYWPGKCSLSWFVACPVCDPQTITNFWELNELMRFVMW